MYSKKEIMGEKIIKGVQSMYPVVVTVYSSIDSVMMSVVNEICKKK